MHAIEAIVGPLAVLERFRRERSGARLVELPQGFGLVAATPELRAESGPGELVPGFYRLTAPFARVLDGLSRQGPLVFVETEYFGGDGGQAAVVFRDGHRAFVASTHEDFPVGDDESPISTALSEIGVECNDAVDEFDAVELGRHRSTSEWHEAGR